MQEKEQSLLISIIMTTYNRADFISETIRSIQQQTYPLWELIIVDDGSDDDTKNIIAQLNDNRICFIKAGRFNINGKIKNIGLQHAHGKYIAFIDSDDLWAPDKLSKQMASLHDFPEAGFSLTGGYNFYEKNVPVEYFYEQEGVKMDDIFLSLFKSQIAAFTQVLLLKRECLTKVGGFKENKAFADIEFIIQLAAHFKAVLLYEPLVFRRLHTTNHSAANWEKSFQEGIKLYKYYKNETLVPAPIAHDALFKIHIRFGEAYLKNKKQGKAILQHIKAWKYHPFSIIPFKKISKVLLCHFKVVS